MKKPCWMTGFVRSSRECGRADDSGIPINLAKCDGRVFDNTRGRFCFSALSTTSVDSAARLDKWLWAVRVFKSRSLASDACRAGSVTVNEAPAKPARDVRPGETVMVKQGLVLRTLRVVDVPRARVGANLVSSYC